MNKYPIPQGEASTIRQVSGDEAMDLKASLTATQERDIFRTDSLTEYWVGEDLIDQWAYYGPFVDIQSAYAFREADCPWPLPNKPTKLRFQNPEFCNNLANHFNIASREIHQLAREVGHWTDLETGEEITREGLQHLNRMEAVGWITSKLLLTHSEISEGAEGYRRNIMDDKLPHRTMLECELADAVIRILDLAGLLEFDIGGAIAEKSAFNAFREDHTLEERRKANGGKQF
jgi:hypothetical protein